jgi:hypothetical protein
MTEPIKLPPLTVKMLMDVFGSHADIPPALLCTSWKDGIDIDETSMRAQMLVEAYARLAVEQNTADLKAEVERLRAELARLTTPVPLLEREETGGCILWARDEDGWFESARIGATHWTPLPNVKEPK